MISFSTVLGDALCQNPLNGNILYGAPGGRQLYISRNKGYTWAPFGVPVAFVGESSDNVIKSVAVNPRDTLQLLLGVESNNSAYDRVMKTTDGGTSWTQTWGGSFTYFGKPVEFKAVHPDTVYTMGSDTLWRSTDFGGSWDTVRTTSGLFAAWCDAEERPDSANILFLGDFSTGIWKSSDYGKQWKLVYATSGEIPSIAIDPFNPRRMYASKYSGGGGIVTSTNGGETWQPLNTPISNGGPGWWITCSQSDPGYVYFGVYTSAPYGGIYVSADSGTTWRNFATGMAGIGLVNYGLLVPDSLAVIALQYDGIWRLNYPASIHVTSPNGGEVLRGGNTHQVTWDDANLYKLRVDYSLDDGNSWNLIADSLPSSQHSVSWVLPDTFSTSCKVRVSDALFTATTDMSDTTFTLYTVPVTLLSPVGNEVWDDNSMRYIRWASFNIDSLSIEYSTDNGANWNGITDVAAGIGYYRWTVPALNSTQCRVRVRNIADSTETDESPAPFTIEAISHFHGFIRVTDNGLHTDSLSFGVAAGASDGIDSGTGEVSLPPRPAQGTFDIRWKLPDNLTETKVDIRDTLSGSHPANRFLLEFQPGSGGYPVTFHWSPDSLHSGTLILRDTLTHGARASADMRLDDRIVIADTSITALEILECGSLKISFGQTDAWSLFSLPVIVGDRRTSSIFPSTISHVFSFQNGYQVCDTLVPGLGYWVRALPTDLFGCPCTAETIHVNRGWNMIGSLTGPVAVASIQTQPDSIIGSPLYGYSGVYTLADSIMPGEGYWVKTTAAGSLVLSAQHGSMNHRRAAAITAAPDLHSITISDEEGHQQKLIFGSGVRSEDEAYYELPPILPEIYFDARFENGSRFAKIPQNNQKTRTLGIILSTTKNKIFFSWEVENEIKLTYILVTKNRDQVMGEIPLQGKGSWTIAGVQHLTISIEVHQTFSSIATPKEFSLGHLYPNPFNPTTTVRYAVPVDAFVTIRIYSTIGQEITQLVDGRVVPGEYFTQWDGRNHDGGTIGSGVYFVRMSGRPVSATPGTRDFTAVERVLYIK